MKTFRDRRKSILRKLLTLRKCIGDLRSSEEKLRRSEEKYRSLIENSNSMIFRWKPDGTVTYMNRTALETFGYSPGEAIGRNIGQFIPHEETRAAIEGIASDIIAHPDRYVNMENENRKKDGGTVWSAWTNKAITDPYTNEVEILSIGNNITRLKQAENELRQRENEFRTLAENSPDFIARLDRGFCYRYINPAGENFLGLGREKVIGRTNGELGIPELQVRIMENLYRRVFEQCREQTMEFALPYQGGEKCLQVRLVPERGEAGETGLIMAIGRDVTELKNTQLAAELRAREAEKAEEQVKYISFHDRVTGLYNRTYFEEELRRLDTGRELPLSVIMGDVNNLKLTNDAFGHREGDLLLQKIARVLTASCRDEDIIARWGGDEFIILLPKTDAATAQGVADRIRRECQRAKDGIMQPTIALGVSTKERPERNVDDVLRESEDGMYRRKLLEAKSIRNSTVASLLKAVRDRGYEDRYHLRRVRDLALALGKALALPAVQLQELGLLAVLHDIGKVTVPADIVFKPGKLTHRERELVMRDADTGYRITRTFDSFAHVADEILASHEHWDGSGSPQGQRGEAIPILARILAIVDAYDAMTQQRPYRSALSAEEAVEELLRAAGRQFDPHLTELFISGVLKRPVLHH